MGTLIQDGRPQSIAKLPYFSGFMVDITIVNRGYFMVYKPTYNWGVISHVPIEHHLTIRYMVYNGYYFW